jgi:DNA-binding transcriptional LysR family regulator
MFDVRQLRFAIAAADHGSFYRAARALEVDQSTVSRSIIRLERALGAKLFNRSRSGVVTTNAGAQFLRSARAIIMNADRMVATMRAAGQGRAGSLIVGHNSSVSAGNLRATILAWQKENPDVDFESVEADRSALLAELDANGIDIAILLGEAELDGFRREPFWSERILLALPADHPLASRDTVQWTDLRSERFVVPAADPGPDIRDMLIGRLSMSGVQPNIKISQTTRETILSLIGASGRMSIVCEGSGGIRYPDMVYRPVHGERGSALTGYSGYWCDENSNPALRRFLGFIRARYALSFNL